MIGFDETIISQFANSPILTAILTDFNDYIDPAADFELFYTAVMDVLTAEGYGLDVWGRIVGVGRVVQVAGTYLYFGFAETGTFNANGFAETGETGAFWDGSSPLTEPYNLPDADYRLLILAKAAFNITDGSIPAINRILLALFPGRGNCYVVDNLDMTMSYTFSFGLTPIENAILNQSGVLPRPTGVSASVVIL